MHVLKHSSKVNSININFIKFLTDLHDWFKNYFNKGV